MFRLSTSFALLVLIVTLAISTQPASGVGADPNVSGTSTTVASKKFATTTSTPIGTNSDQIPNETDSNLTPRVLADKSKTVGPDSMDAVLSAGGANRAIRSGRIVVKFRDELKVRCAQGVNKNSLTCAATRAPRGVGVQQNNPIRDAIAMLDRFTGDVQPAISKSAEQLAQMERAASERTGKAQPDLAGYMFVTVEPSALREAAEAFNELDSVEFAQVDYMPIPAQEDCPLQDLALQKGPGVWGDNVVTCSSTTDPVTGAIIICEPPGPIFITQSPSNKYQGVPAIELTGGAIVCNRPSRWALYMSQYLQGTAVPDFFVAGGAICADAFYERTPSFQPFPLWDCSPNCNAFDECVANAARTSGSGCQYGCRDTACSDYISQTLGFTVCSDAASSHGWDSTCATLANIYCPTIEPLATPYTGTFFDSGMPRTDFASESCFNIIYGLPAYSTYSFDDSVAYDACFTLRGPGTPNTAGSAGILKYTDILNCDGIRPWGFTGGQCLYPFPFLQVGEPNGVFPVSQCDGIAQSGVQQFLNAGIMRSDLSPTDSVNAGEAQFDNAFKAEPFLFSHDCLTPEAFIPGCYNTQCCVYVCVNDPVCCYGGWDANCVKEAFTNPTLCQARSINTDVWVDSEAVPNFDFVPVPVPEGFPETRARNLGLFRTKLPNTTLVSEYIGDFQTLANNSGGSTQPGIIPLGAINAQTAASVTAGSFQVNNGYRITDPGSTNWMLIGASNNKRGTLFKATGAGTGTGVADDMSLPLPLDQTYAFMNTGYSGGGIDVQGMVDFATGIGFSGTSVLGDQITVGVIDYSADIKHADLVGQVSVEANQTILIAAPGTSPLFNPDHGTAVLGVLVAKDDGVGITGLLPLAHAIFYPAVTKAQGGRLATAIISAGNDLRDADVLCIPLEYGAGFTLSSDTFVNQLFGVLDGLGTTIVIPAGNGGYEVQSVTDAIAITVGAVWPGAQTPLPYGASLGGCNDLVPPPSPQFPGMAYCRFKSSNWSTTTGQQTNGGVDVSGWGTGICTLGVGTLFHKGDQVSPYEISPTSYPVGGLQTYQANFGQTSGACAMIAGLIGAMNGFSKEVFGGSIGNTAIRNILNNVETDSQGLPTGGTLGTVVPQCNQPYTALPSTSSDDPWVVSAGDTAVSGTAHNVGGFPLAQTCLTYIISNQSYPGGVPFGIEVITGTNVIGNKFSVGTLNNKFLQIQSQQRGRGSRGFGYGPPVQYVSMGKATDVQVRAVLPVANSSQVGDVLFQGFGLVSGSSGGATNTQALGILYAYNRTANRWIYLNFGYLTNTVPTVNTPNVQQRLSCTGYDPENFVVNENGQHVIYTRYITFGFGVIGAYKTFWDQFFIQLNPPLNIPPCENG